MDLKEENKVLRELLKHNRAIDVEYNIDDYSKEEKVSSAVLFDIPL